MKPLLRWKIFRLCRGARRVVEARSTKCWVWWFGAYYIDPKHLVIVVAVPTDAVRDNLRREAALGAELQELLVQVLWPESARPHVVFDIESEETVARETNGSWWYHYK